jgi:outer membrane protein TolC
LRCKKNYDVKLAGLAIINAREVNSISASSLAPTASANFGRQRFASPAFGPSGVRYDIFQTTFDASWELDFLGKNFERYKASKMRFLQQAELFRAANLRLVSEVTQNYVRLRVAQKQVKNFAEIAALRQQLADIAAKKDKIGSGFKTEIHQAEINLSNALTQLNEAQADEKILGYKLAVLLGISLEEMQEILAKLPPQKILQNSPNLTAVGFKSDILQRRPDIVAAQYEIDATGFEESAQLKEFFPSFSLNVRTGGGAKSPSASAKNGNNLKDIRGNISLPIFPITNLIAQYKITKAKTKEALLDYEKTVLSAIEECESQLVRYSNARKVESNANRAFLASKKILKIDEKKRELGAISDENLLGTKISTLTNEVQMMQKKSESLINLVALHKAIGGGFDGYEMKFKKDAVIWRKIKPTKE